MPVLTVLHDERCLLCQRVRRWMLDEPAYCNLEFVAAGSPEAERRYPGLDPSATLEELHVIDEQGQVYRGAKAWIMCLYALRRYRSLALGLGHSPMGMAAARGAMARISANRRRSWWAWLFRDRHPGRVDQIRSAR